MKLNELTIENFGVLAGKSLKFGAGLQVIYGANEAGKSTLLQLIRSVLFGFPHRCDYAVADRSGEMAATALAELDSGEQIRFRRRKGRSSTVTGEYVGSLDSIDDESLAEIVGANDLQYNNLFAITLAELSAGEESLKHVGLSQALYGSGTGSIASFQTALNQIREDHTRLFKPRGRTLPINSVLDRIRQQSEELRLASVRPSDYGEMVANVQRLETEAEEVKKKFELKQREQDQRVRLLACEKAYAEFTTLSKSHFANAEKLDDNKFVEVGRLAAELDSSRASQKQNETDVAERKSQLARIQIDPTLSEEADSIRSLYQRLSEIESCRADIVKRQEKSKTTKKNVLDSLREIHPDWTLESLADLPSGLEQRREVAELLKLWIEDRSKRSALEGRKAELEQQIREIGELPEKASAGPDNWQDLSQRLPDVVGKLEVLKTHHEELEQRKQQFVVLQKISTEKFDLPLQVPAASVPTLESIQDFVDEQSERVASLEAVANSVDKLQAERTGVAKQLEAWTETHDLPSPADVAASRMTRDRVWQWICQRFIEDAPQDEEAIRWFAENDDWKSAYESLVSRSDELTDRQLDDASGMQQRQQLQSALETLSRQLEDETARQRKLKHAADSTAERWAELWRPTGLTPLAPTEMLVWAELRERYEVEQNRVAISEAKCLKAFELISQFVKEAHCDQSPEDVVELSEQLQQLREELNFAQKLESERNATRDKLNAIRGELESITVSSKAVDLRLTQIETQWQELRTTLGVPSSWDLPTADLALERIVMARSRFQGAIELDQRVAAMNASIESFEGEVRRLAGKLKVTLLANETDAEETLVAPKRTPEDVVRTVFIRLEESIKALREQKQLNDDLLRLETRQKQIRSRIEGCEARLSDLASESGYDDVAKFQTFVMEHSAQRTQLQRVAVLQKELMTHLNAERWDDAIATLSTTDFDALHRQQDSDHALAKLEEAYQHVLKEAGVARKELAELDAAPVTAKIASDLESLRAELGGHVDQWAPLVLADRLMKRAIERFRKQRQPQLLLEVATLLSRLTGGQYVRVHSQLDDKETLLVTDGAGRTKSPEQLSTGTREQLYLAIRLAYIRHYCRSSESLPLVLDDIVVNFDNDRAKATLEVLFEMSREHQILFMTCHRNVVEMIQGVLPVASPVHLKTSDDERELSSASVPVPKAKRRRKRKDAVDPDQQILF